MLAGLALLIVAGTVPIRGTVVDPAGQPIAGAQIRLTCDDAPVQARTSATGTFAITASGSAPCLLRVGHPGFAEVIRVVGPVPDELSITLPLAAVDERIEVHAARTGLAAVATGGTGSATLGAEAMSVLGPDVARWIVLAERAAGQPIGTRTLRLNGIDSSLPPPTEMITTIGVGADPFSVETSGADRLRLDIATEPSRRWQFALSPGLASTSERDPLMPEASEYSQVRAASAGGPVTRSGDLRIFASGSNHHHAAYPTYLESTREDDRLAAGVSSNSESTTLTAGGAGSRGPVSVNLTVFNHRARITNGGVGGRTGPAGAANLDLATTRVQTGWRWARSTLIARGGLAIERRQREMSASNSGLGVVFADRLMSGAPDALANAQRDSTWSFRQLIESSPANPRGWLAGVETRSEALRESRTFNPDGTLYLTGATDSEGTLFRRYGEASEAETARMFAVFAQRILVNSSRAWLRVGGRAEWQPGYGSTFAPRIAGAVRAGRLLLGGNLGQFSDLWPAPEELERQFRINAPALASRGDRVWPIVLAGEGGRRSDLVARASVVRPFRTASVALEQTVTVGRNLAGLSRTLAVGQLVDTLDHDRGLARTQTHLRFDLPLGRWHATAHYEYAHSMDDSPGTFALPARQADLAAERGPSSGIARHGFTGLVSGTLKGQVRVLMTARVASGLPYSLLTGADPEGLLTFSGRVSDGRNQERFAPTSDVSAYAARQFRVPWLGLALDTGVRLENLLAAVTALDVERSATSSFAGRAVAASGGRSLSFWTTIARR